MTPRPLEAYFDLQLRFAERWALLADAPLVEAIGRCTNFRRRFGLDGPAGDRAWQAYLDRIPRCADQEERLERSLEAAEAAPVPSPSSFGCFSYDPGGSGGPLRLHFMPEDRHRGDSPLAVGRIPERQAELRALFEDVRSRHPEVRQVAGCSWLYHVDAYRRLFPPVYIESLEPASGPLRLTGSSLWGQVLDHRYALRPGVVALVVAGLRPETARAPWRAFPLQPLIPCCPVARFFEAFGVA